MTERDPRDPRRPPEGNAFRDSFLALVERPEFRAAAHTFGQMLDELAHECVLVVRDREKPDPDYSRRHLTAAAADLRQVIEALRSLCDFRGEIDDARAAVAANDALKVLTPLADRLDGTFAEPEPG